MFFRFFVIFPALRGLPTLRSFSGSRSFGSISHTFPSFEAFRRLASIIFRTLSAVTPKRFAASAVLMIFMAQKYSILRNYLALTIISLTSEDRAPIVTRTKERADKCD